MSITKKEAYYTSSNGFTGIHTCIWLDSEKEPKGLFQIAHGLGEHMKRYDEFASYLAAHGFVVFGNDHLGHGQSVFEEDEYGYFGSVDGDKRIVDDVHILSLIMKKRYPQLPLILFGHGIGSMAARVYAADFSDELSAVILSGTVELPSALIALETPVSFLCDRFGDKLIVNDRIIDKILSLGIKGKKCDKDWHTSSEARLNDYLMDELCNKPLTLGGARDILSLSNTACSTNWVSKLNPDLKILVVSGANDPVSINGRTIIALSDNLEDVGITPEIRMYPCLRHDILSEDDGGLVYKEILDFCNSIL